MDKFSQNALIPSQIDPKAPANDSKSSLSGINSLTRLQRETLPHFIACKSIEAACRKAGISKQSYFRWIKDENYRIQVEAARESLVEEALARLKFAVIDAAEVMADLTQDSEKWVRLRAAEQVLSLFFRAKEVEELSSRLESVERLVVERKTFK
jgi:hypothetical protein